MSKVLRLYNTYSRSINEARLACGELVTTPGIKESPSHGTLYICGPTVYSESHLGHALTYVRADLFRRVLKSLFNVRLTTVMNITDVDDKILAKSKEELPHGTEPSTKPEEHPFTRVSERYYQSFVDDMNHVRVTPPDLTIKVSRQISIITNYIRQLERKGHAYLATNGDIYFRVSSIPNYQGRTDSRKDSQGAAEDPKVDGRDFALWKAAKPYEPAWDYTSDVTGRHLPGRPGWHVQCSAISNAIFGDRLDFHFSGKDLIFPHNYNEQACCCAYHSLDTAKDINVWSANWLHSGHLVLRDEKMSKSLGNVVGIKKFITDSSVNALRLLCVGSHYRSDVNFNDELLTKMKSLDHKLSAFSSHLSDELRRSEEDPLISELDEGAFIDIEAHVDKVHQDIIDGVCDDFDLSKGLQSILDLAKVVYNAGSTNIRPRDLVITRQLLVEWCSMCGLEYQSTGDSSNVQLINLVRDFRQEIRDQVVAEMKKHKHKAAGQIDYDDFLVSLLKNCDNVRSRLDELGFVVRDNKTKS